MLESIMMTLLVEYCAIKRRAKELKSVTYLYLLDMFPLCKIRRNQTN